MTDQPGIMHICRTREEATAKVAAALLLGLEASVKKNRDRSGGWFVTVTSP